MKRKLIWVALLILSIILISFYGGVLSYSIFTTILLLPVISYFYILLVALTFKIYQEMDNSEVVSGRMNDYYFTLQNDMPFAFAGLKVILFPDNFEVVDVPKDVDYELLPGEQFCFKTKLMCKYRGVYEVGVQAVIISDFLHLFDWKYKLISTYKVTVLPKLVELHRIKAIDEIIALQTKENVSGESIPDVVIRDYIAGDSLRRIHWKATAKTGELKVRQYYDEYKKDVSIHFTTKRYSENQKVFLPLENKILETVIAITNYFIRNNITVSVYGEEVSNQKSFDSFYEKLSNVIFDEDNAFDYSYSEAGRLSFLVLHEITEEIIDETGKQINEGNYVIIYLITDADAGEYKIYSNERRKIILLNPEEDLNIAL